MTEAVRQALSGVADILWPRVCPVADCGRASDRPGRHVCSVCFAALPLLEAGGECALCGMPVPAATHHAFVCEECQRTKPAFARARAALRYVGPVPTLVQDFKYRKALHLAADFGDLLLAAVRAKFDASAIDAVLPVPLHPHRLRERGYNQAELLAAPLARALDRRLDTASLVRRRDTEHQARSTGRERRQNLHAAFAVARPDWVRGRTLLLVDDVMTTGMTFSACARELRAAGAAQVWCLALARALRA